MRRLLGHRPWLLAAMAATAALPGAFLLAFGDRPIVLEPAVHFAMVVSAASAAAAASVALCVAGMRRRDGRTVLLSIAFSTMTALLLVHGLTSPGMLVGPNGVVALAGGISLPVGAALLILTAVPALRRPRRTGLLLALQLALGAAVAALALLAVAVPALVPAVPAAGSDAALALLAIGGALWLALAGRALRTFALTNRATDLMVAAGCVWCAIAQYPQLVSGYGKLGFYAGHMLEVAGVGLLAIPVMLDLVRGGAVTAAGGRPLRDRGGRRRGGLPRAPRARPAGHAGREGRLDRAPHAPRRDARRAGGGGDAAAAADAAPSGHGRPAARHRQAFGARAHPAQAGRAHRRRVRRDQVASRLPACAC